MYHKPSSHTQLPSSTPIQQLKLLHISTLIWHYTNLGAVAKNFLCTPQYAGRSCQVVILCPVPYIPFISPFLPYTCICPTVNPIYPLDPLHLTIYFSMYIYIYMYIYVNTYIYMMPCSTRPAWPASGRRSQGHHMRMHLPIQRFRVQGIGFKVGSI